MTTLLSDIRCAHSRIEHLFWEWGAKMTSSQFLVLTGVEANEGRFQKEIGAAVGLDRSTVSDVCLKLEANGWIKRVPNPKDRRELRLSLTAAGRRELVKAREVMKKVEHVIGDCNGLRDGLIRIAKAGH